MRLARLARGWHTPNVLFSSIKYLFLKDIKECTNRVRRKKSSGGGCAPKEMLRKRLARLARYGEFFQHLRSREQRADLLEKDGTEVGTENEDMSTTTLDHAMHWLSLGIAVIPLFFRSKVPAVPAWRQFQTELPTEQQVKSWFAPRRNLAIITGWRDLVVLDFDTIEAYVDWSLTHPIQTYTVLTRRGVHVYLFSDEPTATTKLPGIDIKADRGYVAAPPSIHPSGAEYRVMTDTPIIRVATIRDVLPALPVQQPATEYQRDVIVTLPLDPWGNASGDLISRAKRHTLDEFLSLEPTRDGWAVAVCPLHDDHTPSMWVDTRRQICGCHVCTAKPMDVINLYAALHGVSNRQAILDLAK